jgi:plasmid maintenance system antidote protein VapI
MTRADLRRQRALTMRAEGKTYGDIAEALGVTRQRVGQLVRESRRVTMRDFATRRAAAVDDCVAAVEAMVAAGGGE